MSFSSCSMRCARTLAALVVGGLFSGAIFVAACTAADGELAIDGMKACLAWCALSDQVCDTATASETCEEYCERNFANAGAYCKGTVSQKYACYLRELQAQANADAANLCDWVCKQEHYEAEDCIRMLGCEASPYFCSGDGIDAGTCVCDQYCKEVMYASNCDLIGTTFNCKCYIDNALVGMCDGSLEAVCDWRLRNGCCNQYFNL